MNTQLRAWCAGVVEGAALTLIAAVPVFTNYYSLRVFEPDKAAVLLALSALAALAGAVAALEGGAGAFRRAVREPLVVAAALLAVATAISTALSISPRVSLLGSGERAQGLVGLLTVLALFACVAWIAQVPVRRSRLLGALLLGSIPVSAVAIAQAAGIVLVPGEVESTARVFGTLSNPIFLGAYLMLVMPIALVRALESTRGGRRIVAAGLVLVFVAQFAALALSVSRGPLLGLFAALWAMALAAAGAKGRRGVAAGLVALAVLGAIFLAMFNMSGGPLAPLRSVPVLGRFGQISDTSHGSEAARVHIWSATNRLLAAEPSRLVFGHGPETLKYALLPYGETYMAGRNQADRLVDRAHNVLLDALTMTGLVGAVALFLVYGAWLFTAAVAAHLAPGGSDKRLLALLLVVGTVVGAATWALRPVYGAALTHFGLVGGLVVFLLVALRRRPEAAPPLNLPAIALLGVGVAAVVEAAFGIQTVVTQAVFWFLGGVLVAVSLAASGPAPEVAEAGAAGAGGAAAAGRSAASRSGSPTGPESGRAEITIRWTGTAAALGIVLGAVLGLLVYGTFLYGSSAPADALPTILIVGVLTWLAGLMLASDCAESGTSCGVASIAVLLLYLAVRWLTLTITKDAAALFTVTVWWLVGCAVLAGILLRAPVPKRTPALRGPLAVLYLALGVIGVALVFVLGIFPVQADIYFQSALANFTAALATTDQTQFEQRFNAADALYDRAILRNRQEPIYPMRWGELYTGLGADIMASPGGDAQQKGQAAAEAFGRAQLYAAQAEQLEPLMPYHAYNRGHVQLIFAQSLPEGQDRTNVADNAASAFQAAFDRVNYDPTLTNEFAVARLLQGRTSEAIALLEYSRDTLDPELPSTHQALAQAYRAAGRTDEALAEAEKAMTLGASGPELLVLLGDLERDRGQTGSALNYYKQAAELSPGNWAVLYNLGLLYKDAGETELAMDALMRSLQMAPDTEADRVQAAVDSLLPSNP